MNETPTVTTLPPKQTLRSKLTSPKIIKTGAALAVTALVVVGLKRKLNASCDGSLDVHVESDTTDNA